MQKRSVIPHLIFKPALIILVTCIVTLLPFKTQIPELINHEAEDYDIYDLEFSGKAISDKRHPDIVLIESGETRQEIAEQIALINQNKPAVIGVDVFFGSPSTDSAGDAMLKDISSQFNNIVWGSILSEEAEDKYSDNQSFFLKNTANASHGYINFIGDEHETVRTFIPYIDVNGKDDTAFAVKIAGIFQKEKAQILNRRKNEVEYINFKSNLEYFSAINAEELLYFERTGQLKSMLEGKIILLGFFKKEQPLILEDLHFTPLNTKLSGRSYPDMYGVAIHANILAMILENKYIDRVKVIYSWLLAFVLIFIFCYAEHILEKKGYTLHLFTTFITELLIIVMLVYCSLLLFSATCIRFPLSPIITSFVVKGFYEPITQIWKERKRNKTTKTKQA